MKHFKKFKLEMVMIMQTEVLFINSSFEVNTFISATKVDEMWSDSQVASERYKKPYEVELFPISDGSLMLIKSNVCCNVCV